MSTGMFELVILYKEREAAATATGINEDSKYEPLLRNLASARPTLSLAWKRKEKGIIIIRLRLSSLLW